MLMTTFRYVVEGKGAQASAGFFDLDEAIAYADRLAEEYPAIGRPEVVDQAELIEATEKELTRAERFRAFFSIFREGLGI